MAKFGKVVRSEPYYGNEKVKTKSGKSVKLGTQFANKDGETKVLLNPAGKGVKYSVELKNGKRYTNKGEPKRDRSGKPMKLSKAQRAFRAGYLQSRKDGAKAYKGVKK